MSITELCPGHDRPGQINAFDRRLLPRYPCGCDVRIRFPRSKRGEVRWACIRDLSRGGVGLLLSSLPKRAATVVLEFPSDGAQPASIAGRIIHRALGPDGNCQLGCAFAPLLSGERLKQLLERNRLGLTPQA